MDTRSSSGSASRSDSHTQAAVDGPPQQPRYTTAGTLYNPQTAAPLQPPARRGRAARWPPAVSGDLSAFNNSLLGNFPRTRLRSPPTTASTLRHYSPLQQNYDRAAHPPPDPPHNGRDKPALSLIMPRTSLPLDFPTKDDADSMIPGGIDPLKEQASQEVHEEERGGEEEELTRMDNYSVKTLTSLASYSNPYQKVAQKALDRARETFKAAAETSRQPSRSDFRQGLDGTNAPLSSHALGRDTLDYFSRVPRHAHINSSNRSGVLSSGLGAPQPLTAGPPGQRQYKVSALEGPYRALQTIRKTPSSSAVDEIYPSGNASSLLKAGPRSPSSTPDLPYSPEQNIQLRAAGGLQATRPAAHNPSATAGDSPWDRGCTPVTWVSEPRETRTLAQIKQYYPGGAPRRYNQKNLVSVPEDNSDLPLILNSSKRSQPLMSDGARSQDDARHIVAFYSAKYDLTKTWDERLEELKDRVQNQRLRDSIQDTAARHAELASASSSPQIGKPEDFEVSIFNQMETCQAVEPLLGMAFSTLANYWDNGRLLGHSTGFGRVNKPEEDDLWARSRSVDNDAGQPRFQGRWGLSHSPSQSLAYSDKF